MVLNFASSAVLLPLFACRKKTSPPKPKNKKMSAIDVATTAPATAPAVAAPAAGAPAKDAGLVKGTSLYVGDLVPDASEPVLFEVRSIKLHSGKFYYMKVVGG